MVKDATIYVPAVAIMKMGVYVCNVMGTNDVALVSIGCRYEGMSSR